MTTGEIISRTTVAKPWLIFRLTGAEYVVLFGGAAISVVCCSWLLSLRRKRSAA
jgi:hypothetical protein